MTGGGPWCHRHRRRPPAPRADRAQAKNRAAAGGFSGDPPDQEQVQKIGGSPATTPVTGVWPEVGRNPPSTGKGLGADQLCAGILHAGKQADFGLFWLGDQGAFTPFAELVHRVNRTSSQRTEGTAATVVTARCSWT